jgi:hypothetical protein
LGGTLCDQAFEFAVDFRNNGPRMSAESYVAQANVIAVLTCILYYVFVGYDAKHNRYCSTESAFECIEP